MEITTGTHGDFALFHLAGDFTVKSLAEIRKLFEATVAQGRAYFALDMKNVRFIDTSGIGLIKNMKVILEKKRGYFCMYNVSDAVFSIFKTIGCTDYFHIFKTEKEFQENTTI